MEHDEIITGLRQLRVAWNSHVVPLLKGEDGHPPMEATEPEDVKAFLQATWCAFINELHADGVLRPKFTSYIRRWMAMAPISI